MKTDPFDRIPDLPVVVPVGPSVASNPGDGIVPAYRVESEGRDGSEDSSGGSVVADELHFNNGTITIDIDATGVTLTNIATGETARFSIEGWIRYSDGANEVNITSDGLQVFNGVDSKVFEIFFSAIQENMSVIEDDVCDSGTPARRLIVASAPYPP